MRTRHVGKDPIEYDEWFFSPKEEPYFTSGRPEYPNMETAAVGSYLVENPDFAKKINKSISKQFQKTYDPDAIHNDLVTQFMDEILAEVQQVGDPLEQLLLDSLERVDWDWLAYQYSGPLGAAYPAPKEAPGGVEEGPQTMTPWELADYGGEKGLSEAERLIEESLQTLQQEETPAEAAPAPKKPRKKPRGVPPTDYYPWQGETTWTY